MSVCSLPMTRQPLIRNCEDNMLKIIKMNNLNEKVETKITDNIYVWQCFELGILFTTEDWEIEDYYSALVHRQK
jgi:hypothetical protein